MSGVILLYPDRDDPQATNVTIGLEDVRAVGRIRVWFDFARDAYVVERQTCYSWSIDDPVCDPGWVEMACVAAPLPEEGE